MITANILRETWQAVVLAYKEDIATSVKFSDVLDHDNDQHFTQNIWFPGQMQRVIQGRVKARIFTIDTIFEDNHENDRSTRTVAAGFERMQVIADLCLSYFEELYVDQETIYQGTPVRLMIEGPATFTAIWDTAGKMTTGCRLVAQFTTHQQVCAATHFNS